MTNAMRTILGSFNIQIKHSLVRPMYRYCLFAQPVIYSILTYMMFKKSGQGNFASFVVLGTGLLTLWSCICFSSAGDIERERFMGTLQVIFCTPTSFKLIMLGKILGNTILSLVPFGISFVVVRFVFHGEFYIKEPVSFAISILVTVLSFVGISMIFSAFFTLSRSSRILMNCIEYPIFILCGILFPIEMLPKWTTPLSYILSPTWAARILRMSVEGIENTKLFYYYTCVLVGITIIYFILSYILYNIIDKRTRINGTLEVS